MNHDDERDFAEEAANRRIAADEAEPPTYTRDPGKVDPAVAADWDAFMGLDEDEQLLDLALRIAAQAWRNADDDAERAEVLEGVLQTSYTSWPSTAVTSPHAPLAAAIVRLVSGGAS